LNGWNDLNGLNRQVALVPDVQAVQKVQLDVSCLRSCEMRVVHYLNQFFGGIGAEEQAGMGLEARNGAVGPGKLLEQLLGDRAQVVMTLVCGDNYAVEHEEELVASVVEKVRGAGADLFVAGPCFEAGRYGMAAGALCVAVQSQLGIPVVTGMSEESPGVDLYRDALYIIDSGANAARMREALGKMANLAKKLVGRTAVGLPAEEGYLRRGLLRDQVVEQTAARRLIDMLVAKVSGEPFESEMLPTSFESIPMPSGIKDLSKAKVMLITDGGLVPKGNPDKIHGTAATRWGSYNIKGRDDLRGEEYEISHGGYDARFVQEDPDRLVPLDAMREMEKRGVIGKLHDEFISTSGRANPLSNTRRLGREMAEKAKQEGVDAVILTST
jgi:glycine reductase complex component B subunit gamma